MSGFLIGSGGGSATPSGPAGGDLSGSYPNPTVVKINGSTVPTGGSLTTGNVLQVSGAGALSYAALNLAGGANFVTGALPAGNQAAQTLGGDLSGTTASGTVIKLQGRTVSSSAPTNGQVLAWNSTNNDWEPTNTASTIVSGQDYSFSNTSSDVSGYDQLLDTATGSEADLSASVTSGGGKTLIEAFASVASSPGVSIIPAGLWEFNFYAYVSLLGAFTTTLTFDVFTRTSGGVETLLFSAVSGNLTVTSVGFFTLLFNNTTDTYIPNTTRIVIKVSATTTSIAAVTAHFVFDGSTHASLVRTPIAGAALQLGGDLSGTTDVATVIKISGVSPIAITPANLQWTIGTSAPLLQQADQTAGSTNGQVLTIQSQNATGTTSTGGALAFKAGTGTTAGGAITFNAAATTTLAEAGRVTAAGAWQFGTNTNQATSGSLNFQNNTSIAAFRNAANSADVIFLASNNANDLGVGGTLGHANQCRVVQLNGTLAAQAFIASTQVMNLQISSANDFIALGTTPATAGLLRTPNNTTILNARNAGNTADIQLLQLDNSNNFNLGNGATAPTLIQTAAPTVQFVTGVSSPTIKQVDNTTNSATAQTLTIQAQNATGTTSIGGGLTLKAGTGTSTNGTVNVVANEFDWDNGATFNVLQTKGNATSTDATTAQTLITYTPTNNSGHSLEITVVGYNTANNNDFAKYQFTLGVVTTSNTPVIVGVNSAINVQTNGAGSTFVGPTVAVSGATITITTKGLAATTIHWVATATRTQVS